MRHLLLILALCFCSTTIAAAAPFDKGAADRPTILLAEVACYGEREMRPEFFQTLWECLAEELQNAKEQSFVPNFSRMNEGLANEKNSNNDVFSLIHMDAIAHGAMYRRENAAASMARYADKLYGREYFWDEKKMAARRARLGKPYKLTVEVETAMREAAARYGADYLLFCNLWDVHTELKKSIFNATATPAERAKKLQLEMDYYLINVHTGKVYEGHNTTSKRGQIINILFGKYGKGATVQQLLQVMFEKQAEQTVQDIYGKGKKALEAGL